jgi:hypothetical protein
VSRAEPLSFYARAGRYLGTEINYFTWQENPRLRKRLTGPQWRRLKHKGRSPRGNRTYYQNAPNKGRPTPRQRKPRHGPVSA